MLVGFPLRSHMSNTCRLPFTVVPRMSNSMLIQNHLCRKKVFSTEERDLLEVRRVSLEVAVLQSGISDARVRHSAASALFVCGLIRGNPMIYLVGYLVSGFKGLGFDSDAGLILNSVGGYG